MFAEEARWIRNALDQLPLDCARVIDVGSQSLEFRTQLQPWVDQDVHRPLRDRGAQITYLDFQDADGVDVVADITAAGLAVDLQPGDLVICCNLLEHVTDRRQTLRNLGRLVRHGGHLVVSVPRRFPHHEDPIDTMYRPSPRELTADVQAAVAADVVAAGTVQMRRRDAYISPRSALRRHVPQLRWATSCAVLRRR